MPKFDEIQQLLHDFHKGKAIAVLDKYSDIAGDQFPGEFNVSGFHKEILNLPSNPSSLWGIDRCLRIQEVPDAIHSFVFHMGIFAKSIDLKNDFSDPFKDTRFKKLQEEIIGQFLEVLQLLKMDLSEVEATYLDGVTLGGTQEGRDKILKRVYEFPADVVSKQFLNNKVTMFPVQSLANVDINSVEGALVGPRLEVAYHGIEIGTVVFNCFKVENGNLVPINYVAGYALGIERICAALRTQDFISSIPRYQKAFDVLNEKCEPAKSSLFKKEVYTIIYGAEVLAHPPDILSEHQKEKLGVLKKEIGSKQRFLGIRDIEEIVKSFK